MPEIVGLARLLAVCAELGIQLILLSAAAISVRPFSVALEDRCRGAVPGRCGMDQLSLRFAAFCNKLEGAWQSHGNNWSRFTEYEQETIALKHFNRDYGGSGLFDYVEWQRGEKVDVAIRGLRRIGSDRLAAILERCFALLSSYRFDIENDSVSEFLESLPIAPKEEWYRLEQEAESLYSDFYERWERCFAEFERTGDGGT
ncbi:MAG: hypothetical protein IT432_04985 [Phycisphaerales bacterium]|nr:hypothetical protein [Phycisphaerales bacterium]